MAITIPGLSLSILRQETSTQAGKPVLIGGRFTAFGIGIPSLIRIFLEGPSYNPEVKTFDSFAQPFSGDYSAQVVTEKDGEYVVYSQAYPLPALPSGPALPANLLLLPPIAESPKPPLVVGIPAPGGVNAQLPTGAEFLSAPVQSPIEIAVGAPSVFLSGLGGGAAPAAPAIPPIIVLPPTEAPYTPPTPVVPPVAPPSPPAYTPPAPPTYPEFPAAPEPPELPELPEIPELKLPTFPALPSSGMLGSPTANLPTQLTIGT